MICGQGFFKSELKRLAKKLNVEDHIHFLGYRDDIAEICKCSDLFVFMSHQEGLPVALMEAMACGLPIICSDIRGNIDLIENKVSGIVVQNSPEQVASSITWMKKNEKMRTKMASNALCAINNFDLVSVEKIMKEIYFVNVVR